MITLQECIAFCGLDEDEVLAITLMSGTNSGPKFAPARMSVTIRSASSLKIEKYPMGTLSWFAVTRSWNCCHASGIAGSG